MSDIYTKSNFMTMQAQKGDKVTVHYVGTLKNGQEFDSSVARNEPIEFVVGDGKMIKGFDTAVMGMEVEGKKTVEIPSDEAYGPSRKENVVQFKKDQFPEGMEPKIGDQLMLTDNNGQQIPVTVTEIQEEEVMLDANHPLAGQDLTFEISLLDIERS